MKVVMMPSNDLNLDNFEALSRYHIIHVHVNTMDIPSCANVTLGGIALKSVLLA